MNRLLPMPTRSTASISACLALSLLLASNEIVFCQRVPMRAMSLLLCRSPTLPCGVSDVLARRPQIEVRRIHAVGVVARMTYKQTVRNLTVMQLIGIPVSEDVLSLKKEMTIPTGVSIAGPDPAVFGTRFRDLLPKSFLDSEWLQIAMPHKTCVVHAA